MTLVIGGKTRVPALSLRVGLATLEVLADLPRVPDSREEAHPLAVKWPNDLLGLCQEKTGKLGGILCEAAGDVLLAGIGINLTRHAYPAELAGVSTSIEESGILVTDVNSLLKREELAQAIASRVVYRLDHDGWREEYSKVLWAIGRKIHFCIGHPSRNDIATGTMEGIDDEGRLLVRDGSGTVNAYSSGEISRLGC